MKFFLFITIVSSILLQFAHPFGAKTTTKKLNSTSLVHHLYGSFKSTFQKPENANVLWTFLTGEKKQISPTTQQDFQKLELGFLFSPSGIHISGIVLIAFFLLKKILKRKIPFLLKLSITTTLLFLPTLAVKRIILMRLFILISQRLKVKFSIEQIFLFTFVIALILGHLKQSPLGFTLSFLFIGTFIALRDQSKFIILLGLMSSHLLIGLFNQTDISPLALLLNLPFLSFFTMLMPIGFLYFTSFQWMKFNYIEPVIRVFILAIHGAAKLTIGTSLSSSLPIILFIWMILLKKKKRYMIILLFLHAGMAIPPVCFFSGSYSKEQKVSVDR